MNTPRIFFVVFTALLLPIAATRSLQAQTGIEYFDGAASIIIGLILCGTALWLAYETKGLLIGESASRTVVEGIRKIAASPRNIERVNEVLTMHMGPNFVLVTISVDFKDDTPAAEVEKTISSIDAQIKADFAAVKRVFVEAESRHEAKKDTDEA